MGANNWNSLCILCYKPASQKRKNRLFSSKFISLLSRHLELNYQNDNVSELEATLLTCKECSKFGNSFCELYFLLNVIKLRVDAEVGKIHEKMISAERIPSRYIPFRMQFEGNIAKTLFNNIISFRQNVITQCGKKLKSCQPKLRLRRLDERPEMGIIITENDLHTPPPPPPSPTEQKSLIEMELDEIFSREDARLIHVLSLFAVLCLSSNDDPLTFLTTRFKTEMETAEEIETEQEEATELNQNQAQAIEHIDMDVGVGNIEEISQFQNLPDEKNGDASSSDPIRAMISKLTQRPTPHQLPCVIDVTGRRRASPLPSSSSTSTTSHLMETEVEVVFEMTKSTGAALSECELCGYTLSCEGEVEKHRALVHNILNYIRCPICHQMFELDNNYQKHRRAPRSKCFLKIVDDGNESCFKSFSPQFPYQTGHNPCPNFCTVEGCHERFENKEFLKIHLKTHGLWDCSRCSKTFGKAHDLAWHEIIMHKKNKRGRKPSNINDDHDHDNQQQTYKCTRCKAWSARSQVIINHFLSNHLDTTSTEVGMRKKGPRPPDPNGEGWKCPLCKIFFNCIKTELDMMRHVKAWHNIEELESSSKVSICGICRAPFRAPDYLRSHIRVVHQQ